MKREILSDITGKLSVLGIPMQNEDATDITIRTEFLDASFSTGSKKVIYEASIFVNEQDNVVYMYEKTTETGHGLSFGGESGTSFQSGKTLFRKVKSIQYAPDGKAYEYTLDLGAIPKSVKETAKQYGWKFKTVLNKNKASYPPDYIPSDIQPQPQPQESAALPQGDGYCANCGMPLDAGANFCKKCGLPSGAAKQTVATLTEQRPNSPHSQPSPQYSDPQGKFFAQGKSSGAMGKSPKPSVLNSILFWIIWTVLTLLCILMIADEFSVLRFAGFALLLAVPIILKKKLFYKFLPSLFSWLAAIILFFIIMAVTGSPDQSKQSDTNLAVLSQGGITVSALEGVFPEDGRITVTKDKNPPAAQTEGITINAYDINLPTGSIVDSIAEIEMPFDKNLLPSGLTPQEGLCAAYYNPKENTWEPVPYQINTDRGVVTVLTDHFSKYAVVYFKDGRKKLSTTLPPFDSMPLEFYSDSELEKIVGELGSGADNNLAAFTAGWNNFNTNYGLTGAAGNILQAAVDSKTVNNVNNLMTEAGLGFAFAQLALDMYSGDNNAAVNNFIKNAANYSAAKWGGSAVNLASVGVTFMDVAINKFAEKALDKNLQKWEDAYRKYYQTNLNVKRSAVDWYNIVKKIHSEFKSPEQFKAKLDEEITQYSQLFWKDPEGYAYVAESTSGIRGFGAGGEYALGVSELSKRYKEYIYGTTMKPVMEVYMKNLCFKEYNKAEAAFKKLKTEMNKEYTITVNLSNYIQVKNLKGTTVRFKNASGQVVHSQNFDDSGRAVVKMSLYGFLKAGGPTTIEVKVPAQDNTPEYNTTLTYKLENTNIALNAPYVPTPKHPEKPAQSSQPQKPAVPEASKPATPTPPVQPPIPEPPVQPPTPEPVKTDPPKPEYDYKAALAAWAADFAAEVNSRKYDDGVCKSTNEFEWVMAPVIRDGQVVGASRIWQTTVYYDGQYKGRTIRSITNEAYDPSNPGPYISLGDLKAKYPQFGR